MTRVQKELIEDIRQKTGMDATAVIEYLYAKGTLDDCVARQHVVKAEFLRRLASTDIKETQLKQDIGEDYGITRERVHQIVTDWRYRQVRA